MTENNAQDTVLQAALAAAAKAETAAAQIQPAIDNIKKIQEEIKTHLDLSKKSALEITALLSQAKTENGEILQLSKKVKDSKADTKILAAIDKANAAAESATTTATNIASSAQNVIKIEEQAKFHLESSKKSTTEISNFLSQSKTASTETLQLVERIKTDSAKTAEIARTADEKDKRVNEYETQLSELISKYSELNQKLEDLLPAATGIGLAKSFNARKKSLGPQMLGYFVLLIFSIVGFIWFGAWALFVEDIKNIDDFIRFAFERSPLIAGLIFLEEFSRRQFKAVARLEEDYAYKETISIAFDGYVKAMGHLDKAASGTLAHDLGKNILDILNQRPGRLMETERDNPIPLEKILEDMISTEKQESKTKVFADVFQSATKNIKVSLLRSTGIIIIVLLVGFYIGQNFGSKNSNLETNIKDAVRSAEILNKNIESLK